MATFLECSSRKIQTWLSEKLASLLEIDPRDTDIDRPFIDCGLDSLKAASLIQDLGTALGRQLSPTLIWDCPTIAALSDRIAGTDDRQRSRSGGKSQKSETEPIAIVGIACRFPGSKDVKAFWQLLASEVDAVTEVPTNRWNIDEFYDPDPIAPGKMNTRWGGFLEKIDQFDPEFFGISPREAALMDPQQRLMLKLTWEALEDAGLPAETLRGSRTGVFVGAMWGDYGFLERRSGAIAQHTATGQDLSIIANRISYTFGFTGPSLTVNTACSSSLVAIHLACQSLRCSESTLAIAGGVNLIVSPDSTVTMSKFGGLSADGRCKAFDASANGYVRGEGAGAIALKPLSLALAAGDPIYCIIKGSAVNNDGFSNGLSAPNPQAQEALLREVYAQSGINPNRVHYVETHGTGTKLGDPIEAKALATVLSSDRAVDRPLIIGSVKTNIGHLEAAAGIAGTIKVACAIARQQLPASLHFHEPNPLIPFEEWRLQVQKSLTSWPYKNEPALAGVSSFGFGGTNCHVVLEEWVNKISYLLPLAAKTEESLRSLARIFLGKLQVSELSLAKIHAEFVGERQVNISDNYRLGMVVNSREGTKEFLENYLQGKTSSSCITSSELNRDGQITEKFSQSKPRIVFVFPGQGSQWFGMGRKLLEQEPVFRASLEQFDRELQHYANWSLLEELTVFSEARSRLSEIEVMWPALLAIEIGLAALWRSWGIEPDVVVGHSIGEVAAACVAGILSLSDAVRIIYHQSCSVSKISDRGGMALVGMSWDAAREAIAGWENSLCLAINSSPDSTVLSGNKAALEAILNDLHSRHISGCLVKTNVAVHSPQIEPLQAELLAALEGIKPRRASVPIVSTLTGTPLDYRQFDAAYWAKNLREPVLFSQATAHLLASGCHTFLELSPHPILIPAIKQSLKKHQISAVLLESLRRGKDDRSVILQSLNHLYLLGKSIRWEKVNNFTSDRYFPGGAGFDCKVEEPGKQVESKFQKPNFPDLKAEILPLSAKTPEALKVLADSWHLQLIEEPNISLHDLCYTASLRRSHHDRKLALVVSSIEELKQSLKALAAGKIDSQLTTVRKSRDIFTTFVFSNNTEDWQIAGRELLEFAPVFKNAIEECDEEFQQYVSWSLLEELQKCDRESRWNDRTFATPAIFALQVALVALWRSWGVIPQAALGQGIGEVAAAFAAGAIGLSDAARSIFCPQQGQTVAETVRSSAPAIPVLVAATSDPENFQAINCHQNNEDAVPFSEAMAAIAKTNCQVFLEVSSHPILLELIAGNLGGKNAIVLPSLTRDRSVREAILASLGKLYSLGVPIEWNQLYPAGGRLVSLPVYPWQRQRYWFETKERSAAESRIEKVENGQQQKYLLETDNSASVSPKIPLQTDWLYEIQWQQQERPLTYSETRAERWLIFSDRTGIGGAIARQLQKQGCAAIIVTAGASYEISPEGNYQINPSVPEDFQKLLRATLNSQNGEFQQKIVYLWNLDALPNSDIDAAFLEAATVANCSSVLYLVQTLAALQVKLLPRLWLVTRNAQPVAAATLLEVTQAPLWGLSQGLALEYPDFWGGIIDLDASALPLENPENLDRKTERESLPAPDRMPSPIGSPHLNSAQNDAIIAESYNLVIQGGIAAKIVEEIRFATQEDRVAFHKGKRYIARLIRSNACQKTADRLATIDSESSYLIVGGLGSLGIKIARWLVAKGARYLVLTGRREAAKLPPDTGREIAELEKQGCQVQILAADASDRDRMSQIIKNIPNLKGAIHAAGIWQQTSIPTIDFNTLVSVLRPKIAGSWILHQLTQEIDLSFFVCFSSIASVWGAKDLGAYAAANQFLDALAHYRKARGLPGLSINWGPWSGGGMAAELTSLKLMGIESLPPEQAIDLLESAIESNVSQVTVAAVDWNVFKAVYQTKRKLPLIDELELKLPCLPPPSEAANFLQKLRSIKPNEGYELLLSRIKREVISVLHLNPSQHLDLQKGFFEMGFDSLMNVELRNRLQNNLGCALPATLTFDYPNIKSLTDYLFNLSGQQQQDAAQNDEEIATILSSLELLSDEEAEALLKLGN